MEISVNGEGVTVDAPLTVSELLQRFDLGERACAVEVNKTIVPKAEHTEHRLGEGDAVEIVTLVGGG